MRKSGKRVSGAESSFFLESPRGSYYTFSLLLQNNDASCNYPYRKYRERFSIKFQSNHSNQSQRTNNLMSQSKLEVHVADAKRGKTCASAF